MPGRCGVLVVCLGLWCAGLPSPNGISAADKKTTAYVTPADAAADPDFALQGEYVAARAGVQVVALGKGEFQTIVYRGGLPGAGWNEREKQEVPEDADGVRELIKALQLEKIERRGPTLGAKPPAGAVVLFDGTPATFEQRWKPGAKLTDEGLLAQGCTTKDTFQDFTLHLEFRLPYMPDARGQQRGNSGLYIHGRYELQMLDSFGLAGKDNECGGIYTQKAPDINMCLPPLAWQTYDLEFTAPQFDEAGQKQAPARLTVRHNGVLIHQNIELPKPSPGSSLPDDKQPGPFHLQNHGDEVRYRNIWIVPRDPAQEAKRPMIPGFERFHASTGGDPAIGGRLLLGELNCTSCHQVEDELKAHLVPRQAPVLTEIGKRAQPLYLLKFLRDPHAEKPGTPMPNLLAGLSEAQSSAAALALANFLASTGTPAEGAGDTQAAQRGQTLFHRVGCVACHAPRETDRKPPPRNSVPLDGLERKYTVTTLAAFLQDPHKARPSGRMPGFQLQDAKGYRDMASYLLGDTGSRSRAPLHPNFKYAVYMGQWEKVPNFDQLKPAKTGEAAGLDLNVAGRTSDFGVRFEGFLNVEREGEYQFTLGSDDGSILSIDGKKVAENDGIHPHSERTGSMRLSKGPHPLRVDYMQGGGEWTLTLEFEGPGLGRQNVANAVSLTADGRGDAPPSDPAEERFVFDAEQARLGESLFVNIGCANCHALKRGAQELKAARMAPPLKQLDVTRGCLAADAGGARPSPVASTTAPIPAPSDTAADSPPGLRVPRYDLNSNQRAALAAVITAPLPAAPPTPSESVANTMLAFNCYACHARGKVGGSERDRNAYFATAVPEMGDEGRVPPPLDGVGDKLNDDWLKNVLQNGANDRPYMHTRMPKFGMTNVGHLIAHFVALDRRTEANIPDLPEPEIRVAAIGRQLVGDKALACIKCHSFGPHKATGIQALNMQTMTRRLREDWFFRYLMDPDAYRPGTRMPSAFASGQATVRDVYGGDPPLQLLAMWTFLKQGDHAGLPEGLVANVIELKPERQPVIYRNFIEGLSPRGIAVGYPEEAHLAWDANTLGLKLLWHGRFLDAGKHWEGRGPGNQFPLGDHIITLEDSSPLAILDDAAAPWPTALPRSRGYKFRGYVLDAQGRPHFRYGSDSFSVEDFPEPVRKGKEGAFVRHLTITAPAPVSGLYLRAAAGSTIVPQADGIYLVNGLVRVKLGGAIGPPVVRESNGRRELLAPVPLTGGQADVTQEIVW